MDQDSPSFSHIRVGVKKYMDSLGDFLAHLAAPFPAAVYDMCICLLLVYYVHNDAKKKGMYRKKAAGKKGG